MRISILGAGYVGLVTASCFADMGNEVLCLDIDSEKVKLLNEGKLPIFEPNLQDIINNNLGGRLQFTTSYEEAIKFGNIIFLAVGTPSLPNGDADLTQVEAASKEIGKYIEDYKVVVNKSTVPIGTSDYVKKTINDAIKTKKNKPSFDVVSNPEFLKEGDAVNDFKKPDRIILGTESLKALEIMRTLYAPFNRQKDRVIEMDNLSAELTKYASNAMLATKISFMNEMSQIAERFGADIENVRKGIGSDSRIGNSFLYPGPGYGGSCFPKDIRALKSAAVKYNYHPKILQSVEKVNDEQKESLYKKMLYHFGNDLQTKTFSIWGLSFKPGTDDIRESPSLVLIDKLITHKSQIKVYDPKAMDKCKKIYGSNKQVIFCNSPQEALVNSDALVIVTEWEEFRSIDIEKIKNSMSIPIIFDGRNIYDPKKMEQNGIKYYGTGRGRSSF